MSKQIARLFKDAPDLATTFVCLCPTEASSLQTIRIHVKNRRKLDVVASSMSAAASLPQKRKRKPAEKEREREKESTPAKTAPPAKVCLLTGLFDTA